ncbi:MAG: hypothetical protein JSW10_05060 [Pseudomonadota bacterium]|nr:MAG: hypothetical protein JSW10_05060 [Pseudomonadota bacterium]
MKQLNFSPAYEAYLQDGRKTTTLRLANTQQLAPGDEVMLTIGWSRDNARDLHRAVVTKVSRKAFGALDVDDLCGESPDCRTPEAARLVLGCIYRTVIDEQHPVFVIGFEHAP